MEIQTQHHWFYPFPPEEKNASMENRNRVNVPIYTTAQCTYAQPHLLEKCLLKQYLYLILKIWTCKKNLFLNCILQCKQIPGNSLFTQLVPRILEQSYSFIVANLFSHSCRSSNVRWNCLNIFCSWINRLATVLIPLLFFTLDLLL